MESADIGRLLLDSVPFLLRGSSLASEISVADDLWRVRMDTGQINQVINNLVINAEHAMHGSGTIDVSAQNIQVEPDAELPLEPGLYVQVSIGDHGEGIPEEVQQKIFDPFFTTKKKGSGLGLATSYSILQQHQGSISVTSQAGKGSTFDFYLPATTKEPSVDKNSGKVELIHGEGKILVMDDIKAIRMLTQSMLAKLGFEVVTCCEGGEAIEKYTAALETDQPFRVVFLDLTIPGGMGGKDTIKRLREIDPQVKAIVASGYSDDAIVANFRDFGFSGSLAKPYGIEDVSKVLNETMEDNQ